MEQPTTRWWWLQCTYDDESLDFIKLWNFFIRKEIYCLFKKGPAPWSLMSGGTKDRIQVSNIP
jgi:hypothetical protein